jgi:hypothetical protein
MFGKKSHHARRLRLEALESRAMLSVAASGLTYETLDLAAAGTFSDTVTGGGQTQKVTGDAALAGDIAYTSPTKGSGAITSISTTGTGFAGFAASGSISDNGGKLTSHLTLTEPISETLKATGKLLVFGYTLTLTLPTFHFDFLGTNVTVSKFSFTFFIPPGYAVLALNAQWDTNSKGSPVALVGVVNNNTTNSVFAVSKESAPLGTVECQWMDATGDLIGKPIPGDTFPIAWNEAGGTYTISKLPKAPKGAANLSMMMYLPGVSPGEGNFAFVLLPWPPP